jgi:hypothetical protein
VGTHVFKETHELDYYKNVGAHVLNKTHELLSVSCSVLARPNLNGYTGRSQATAMSKLDK